MLGYKYLCRMKDHCSPLECMSSFFSYNLYLRDKSRSFFAHWTIFCKKCLHKHFFLKMAERWGINIYVVWKTTIVPLSVCWAFFSYNLYLRDKSRSYFGHWTIFCKKCLHKHFFLKNGGTLGYKYLCRMKDHYSPLECMSSFFSYNLYLRDKSRSFFAHWTIFCKKCPHKQFFLKLAERWGINIYVV